MLLQIPCGRQVKYPLRARLFSSRVLAILGCVSLFSLVWFLDARLTAAGSDNGVPCYMGNYGHQDSDPSLACTESLTPSQEQLLYDSAGAIFANCSDEAMVITNGIGSYVYEWTGEWSGWDAFWAPWSGAYIGFHYDFMDDAGLVAHEGSHYYTGSASETIPDQKQATCTLIPPGPVPVSDTNVTTAKQGAK